MTEVELYGQQHNFADSPHQFSLLVGGIGSGKTVAGAARSIRAAHGRIDGSKIFIPYTGMITAPTYNVLRDATIPTFRDLASDLVESMSTAPPINAKLKNGSQIYFRSAHQPELLRGPSIAWWWGDEAALYTADVWRIMIGRLRQQGQTGYAWLTTTPKGRNWIYKEFMLKERARYGVFRATTRENPYVDLDYYAMLRENYNDEFARQELDGDFVAFEGLIYWEFDRLAHVMAFLPALGARPEHLAIDPEYNLPSALQIPNSGVRTVPFERVVAGVDWGYANPGVIVVFGVDSDGRMWGLREEYARRRRIEEWAQVARQLQIDLGIEIFYCDPSEPDFIQTFIDAGCPAVAADNDVMVGIHAVKNRLVVREDGLPRLIFVPDFVYTASEFEQYQWMSNRDGLQDRPKKANDHACDATRYCVMGVNSHIGEDIAGGLYLAAENPFGEPGY
jgi:phage terminase large subunit-like protein